MLLFLFAATLVGFLTYFRNNSVDVSAINREVAAEDVLGNEQLKKPVYEKPPLDLNGLGELGRAVRLNLEGDEKRKEEDSLQAHQINIYVSDKVSLHRTLPERWNPL